MKKLYLLASLFSVLALAPSISFAEDAPKAMKGDQLAQLKSLLELTPEQEAKLKPILQAQAEALKALSEKEGDPKSKRPEMMKIRQDTRSQMQAILTPEQFQKLPSLTPSSKKKKEGEEKPAKE